ncbi:hypothetical protein PZN02_003551 [Sinorhizobium garamanticum]|uniref:Uncharacterized protein n=1 Tax=Sinorhizobium garamanticum TaxID=680247 RepID=A0ABY8D8G6_9HYPH|nr:hypothetical protein [Sinorhizobium garamanticum]WEX87184.1 hypothetical protein PZN02_003551 [Sinorhizobium garamanticum]
MAIALSHTRPRSLIRPWRFILRPGVAPRFFGGSPLSFENRFHHAVNLATQFGRRRHEAVAQGILIDPPFSLEQRPLADTFKRLQVGGFH